MDKIKIKKIKCRCLEGDGFGAFDKLREADSFLWCQGMRSPEVGYIKWQIEIEWQDGRIFNFRLDVSKNKDNSISGHLRSAQRYFLDKEIPEKIKSSDYFQQGHKFHKEIREKYEASQSA